jgi:hypothetical protein
MGHFSMEKSLNPGSVLGGNQHSVGFRVGLVISLASKPLIDVWENVGDEQPIRSPTLDSALSQSFHGR